MNIKLKKIVIENFKSIKKQTVEFTDKTQIYGENESGKSSIFDAFCWCLFNKNSKGIARFEVRPLDSNNKKINNIEISVELFLNINGNEIIFKKVQKQNWIKKHGATEKRLEGSSNFYFIDTYPINSENEYKLRVSEILDEKYFKLLTNPMEFTSMKWEEQRKALFALVSGVSDIEIAESSEEFAGLSDEFQKANYEMICKKAKTIMSDLKKNREELPVRVDELEKQIVVVDTVQLELTKKQIEVHIVSVDSEISNLSADMAKISELQQTIINKKMDLSGLAFAYENKGLEAKRNIERQITEISYNINNFRYNIDNCNRNLERFEKSLADKTSEIFKLKNELEEFKAKEYIHQDKTCSLCGQVLPGKPIEELIADFEASKQESLNSIILRGKKTNFDIKTLKESIENEKALKNGEQKSLEEMTSKLEAVKELSNNQSKEVPVTETIEYKNLLSEITVLEEELFSKSNLTEIVKDLNNKKSIFANDLADINSKLDSANNEKIKSRIVDLRTLQAKLTQQIADQEGKIYLLEKFLQKKLEIVSLTINQMFGIAKWKLFEQQINGGINETCECLYKGVPYSDLNSAHKIIIGLDIINTLQKNKEISCPVFIDNAESISKGNMPVVDFQTIELHVSDGYKVEIIGGNTYAD